MYDLAIIGGGPAGIAAGVYAARKKLQSIFIAETIGGQSTDSLEIQNWIGTEKISGLDLARQMEQHLRTYAEKHIDIRLGERATDVEKTADGFLITTARGSYPARAILIATGGARRKLDIPGAAEFENKGVTYCASCDGPLFGGQDVVVVGGGNAGFETAAQLLAYAKSVTLIHRGDSFSKADPKTVEAVLAHPNMRALTNSEPVEIKGSSFVESVAVKDRAAGGTTEIPAAGVFVEIGMIPATGFLKNLIELDELGRVKINPRNQRARMRADAANGADLEGVWAAGDCTDELYHQNNIAAGDGVKALEDIYFWLKAAAT